jgi:branched-chain amino acid transport system substrate-binding protein
MLTLVNKRHPNEKWASLVQDDDSGAPREAGYDCAVKELGLNSVLKLRFKPKQMDFSAEILRLEAAGAMALHLGGLPAINSAINSAIIKKAKKQGMNVKFAGLWTDHTPPMLDLAGAEGDGMYIYDFVLPITDKVASGPFLALAEKYMPKDDLPKANRYTMLGYICMKVMADAISKCGKEVTRACVLPTWRRLKTSQPGSARR